MPLKKPKDIPDLPKSRKKSISQLKKAIPAPKEGGVEYYCTVYFKYNPLTKNQEYAVNVETVSLFSYLNYELAIESEKNKKELDIVILGLKAKQSYLTEPNPASAEALFNELYGEITVNIIKQDGSINSAVFDFNVFKKEIKLKEEILPEKKNNRKFCTFKVAEDKFTLAEES